MREKGPEAYENRHKATLDKLEHLNPDFSNVTFHIAHAGDMAATKSFEDMVKTEDFQRKMKDNQGKLIINDVLRWMHLHAETQNDVTLDLDEAVTRMMTEIEFDPKLSRAIPIGIDVIDNYCGGGLRRGQLGIIMAPTGHGKSLVLAAIARKVAWRDEIPVWIVTNELSWKETTERLVSGLLGVEVSRVIHHTYEKIDGKSVRDLWEQEWKGKLGHLLWITDMNREVTTDDVEAELTKQANLHGRTPALICLDFIERMAPINRKAHRAGDTWTWLGAIAQDLTRLAKRRNILIWTACQTNRAGLSGEVTMETGQGSIKHFQEAAAVIGMSKDSSSPIKGQVLKFCSLKQRHSAGGELAWIKSDMKNMQIFNEEDKEARIRDIDRKTELYETHQQKRKKRNG